MPRKFLFQVQRAVFDERFPQWSATINDVPPAATPGTASSSLKTGAKAARQSPCRVALVIATRAFKLERTSTQLHHSTNLQLENPYHN